MVAGGAVQQPNEDRIRRAIIALGLTLAFDLVVLGIYALSPGVEPVVRVVGVAGALLLLVVIGAEIVGLLRRRPWAVAVATPILLLLVVVGAIVFLTALSQRSLNLPIVPLICIWAVWPRGAPSGAQGTPPATLGRADSIRAVAIGLGCAVALAWPVVSAELLRPGGLLISGPADLGASVQLDCQEGVEPGETVNVTYLWTWARAEPIAAGEDQLTIKWTGTINDEPAVPALLTDIPAAGMHQSDMQLGSNQIAVIYGIDLAVERFQGGTVRLNLGRRRGAPGSHGFIEVEARYVRAPQAATNGIWQSLPARASCHW